MGIGIVLIDWMMISSVLGILVGGVLWLFFKNPKLSNSVIIAIAISPPIIYFPFLEYVNRPRSPAVHWQEEFGNPVPPQISLETASAKISNEKYWRFFTFHAEEQTVRIFASQNGFYELSGAEKLTRQILPHNDRTNAFEAYCIEYLEFEAPYYRNQRTDIFGFPTVWVRHCLSTRETFVQIMLP